MLFALVVLKHGNALGDGVAAAGDGHESARKLRRHHDFVAYGTGLLNGADYVTAGTLCGASRIRNTLVHVFPNCLSVNIVSMTASLGGAILAEANLSFLGMGITPPTPSWGAMVSGGYKYLSTQPIIAIAPGIAIIIVVLCFNMCGDALRDALDPKLRGTLGSGKKTKRAKRTKNVKEVA